MEKSVHVILSLVQMIKVQHSLGKRKKRGCLAWKTNSIKQDGANVKGQYYSTEFFSFYK